MASEMEQQIEMRPAKKEGGEKAKGEGNASFLRAARAGNLEKVLEYLKGSTDINTSNSNGLNALHLASKEGHVNVVTELLNRGANVDAATKKGNTALHIASLAGQEEIVKILVQHGATVNVQSQNGFTPLYMAAQENHAEVVKFLLGNAASQTLATEDGFTPLAVALQQGHDRVVAVLLENDARGKVRLPALHIAAKKDDVKAATLLLQNEHNVDNQSKSGFTPLHIAAHYGNINVGGLLIEKNADVNFKARNAITPLHVSSKWGRTNMVTLLLDNNATITCSTRDGLTPLHCAARSGHDQVVDLLLERGAPVSAKTKNGLTPLHMSAQGDHVDCARLLLYHKAPMDDVTVDYLTPLHVAAHCGNVRTAKLLLDRKCEPNSRALNGFTPLHIACKKNRIKVVELLLKYGGTIEATTESGLTPLHVSAFMGHMNIVIFLIQHGANTDTPTVRGETALHLAARANQTDIIRILLRNGAAVDAKAREDQTPLHIAARLGNVDNVLLLLQHGAAPNATTKDQYTPLHIAAKEGHEEVAQVLLEHGANQNLTTAKGFTPLHIAAKYGNIKVARLLLQKDADPNMQGKNGLTPLHVATHYNHVNVALLLLENGASPHCAAKNGYTPLHIAAKKNQMDIATTLLEYGAKPNAESKNGFTPLHLASQEGHTDMVSLLLEHEADVNCKAKNGLTPMHLAAQEDKVPVAEILVKYNSQIDPQTKAGYTPLHTACHFGQINMIRFLLEHGASVNATTKVGYTPLHQAAQQGHVLVINLLLKYNASPNAVTNNGQTALSIAQRLGYISVVEILKNVTEVTVSPSNQGERLSVVSPETMTETLMTDSEDEEGGDESLVIDTAYTHLHTDMKLDDTFSPAKDDRDLRFFGSASDPRYSTLSSTAGQDASDLQYGADDSADAPVFEKFERVQEEKLQSSAAPTLHAPKALEESRTGMYGSYSGVSFASSFDPDNIAVDRHPVYSGFLVSFMVDARGGAMRGCRHSGVRIIVPPGKACMPTRVTCKLVKKEKLTNPPPLMEGEALASRVLEMGPVGAKFQGNVIIEVPHFASLRGKEREIVILRSDNGESWREHPIDATEDAFHEALNGSFEGEDLESAEELYHRRITRIITSDFPQYFAIVTRVRQESNSIGPEGGMISSTVVPQVQAVFPEGSLTKKIKVGLQAQPVPPEVVSKMHGNRVAVSPIVTVEPRRRKFHKPITLTIPVPKASQKGMLNQYGGDAPTLRLLCSITGVDSFAYLKGDTGGIETTPTGKGGTSPSQWEDITGTTPLSFVNDCVSFTTSVSARFWLMDCQNIGEAAKMATELYHEAIPAPFMSKFVVFAKRHDPQECRLRVFCMTDDKMDKTLENQEHFAEVARSRDVEVLEGKPQYVEMGGNLVPVTKSGDQLYINFHAFRENRLPMTVRVRDSNLEPVGRIAFMREPKVQRGEAPQTPICNLNITLPDTIIGETQDGLQLGELQEKYDQLRGPIVEDQISRAELRLTDIADTLQDDWEPLARQLGITEEEIIKIRTEYTYPSEQALVMLHLWVQKNQDKATGETFAGNELERALKKISREDVIRKCMYNVEEVTDEIERAAAKEQLDQDGFDEFKEELGQSPQSSMQRGLSLDVSYDEHDMVKESESAQEESGSDASSVVEKDKDRVDQSPVHEAVSPTIKDRDPLAIDELISSMEESKVEGMDDRVSVSSEEGGAPPGKKQPLVGVPGDVVVVEESITTEEGTTVHGMDDRISLSSDEGDRRPVVEAPIKTEPGTNVQGMDDRASVSSSEDSMIVRDDDKDQAVTQDQLAQRLSEGDQITPQDAQQIQSEPAPAETSSLSDARELASPVPSVSPAEVGSPVESDSERMGVRVYTDTVEGDPQVETDVQEFEETLPDGTVIKRKVIKTKQKQTIVKRVVMEGPEGELPTTEEQAQEMLGSAEYDEPGVTKYTDILEGEPESSTDVQEFEETLPDGTVVKRRVVTTTEQQLKTERTVMEGDFPEFEGESIPVDEKPIEYDDSPDARSGPPAVEEEFIEEDLREQAQQARSPVADEYPIEEEITTTPERAPESAPEPIAEDNIVPVPRDEVLEDEMFHDKAQSDQQFPQEATIPDEQTPAEDGGELAVRDEGELDEAAGGEDMQTTRLVMKKQVHKKTIIRDGKEETIVTEDTHVEQDNQGPEELQGSMQEIIDQFMEGKTELGDQPAEEEPQQ